MKLRQSLAVVVLTGAGMLASATGAESRTHDASSSLVPRIVARALLAVVSITTRQIEYDQFKNAIEPHVFRATMGERVNFVKRVDLPVHVEFGVDPSQHHVVQIPGTGPFWAVFHRPGTHPYVVHIYAAKTTTTLHGIVEVVEDPQHPWAPGTCAAVVMGVCIEP